MVSRRKILSRSKDNLNDQEEEDVWYQKDKLFREHVQEVLDKWRQIDDEIWAKVIVFERNRRVAKAYARVPVLTVNGSEDGFDGMRIGLCGFDNPMRDAKTAELKRQIGQGVKVKMDDAGNILVRRYAKSNVYIKTPTSNSYMDDAATDIQPNTPLEFEKVYKIFDMKKFQANVNRELSRAYPDRRRLETQCLSIINFVKSENDILECPIWIMIVNVVAMDMLKSKLPPVHRPLDIKNRPKIPIPDEDPYSEAIGSASSSGSSGLVGNGSAGEGAGNKEIDSTKNHNLMQQPHPGAKRSDKPPKLPPRDSNYSHAIKFDYNPADLGNRYSVRGKSDKGKDKEKYDDPYYCGMSARVPNFVKQNGKTPSKEKKSGFLSKLDKKSKESDKEKELTEKEAMQMKQQRYVQMPHPASFSTLYQLHQMQTTQNTVSKKGNFSRHNSQPEQFNMWHTKSYESGINAELESPYPIYGRLETSNRGYVPAIPRSKVYVGEWE